MTHWDRLEPNTTDETLLEGLQARIADPLWMLARQWQNGEFDGEDAASPIRVVCRTKSHELTQVRFGEDHTRDLGGNIPLEPLVEAIAPTSYSAEDVASLISVAMSIWPSAAGSQATARQRLKTLYPFAPESFRPDHPLPAAAERRLRLLSRHAFDIFALIEDEGARLLAQMSNVTDWVSAVNDLVEGRGRKIAAQADAWNSDALSYAATVSGRAGTSDYRISLADYGGGRLDWFSFDRVEGDQPTVAGQSKTQVVDTIPLQLNYAGQPVSRFWEFEDGEVHFGGIAAGPADISRMIVADFAAIGGDDTFVVPVEVPVGSITRVTSLTVVDTFGESIAANAIPDGDDPLPLHCHRVRAAQRLDRTTAATGTLPFDLFALDGDAEPSGIKGPWVPVLPVTANTMNGRALERISLRRDEDANLAWAVEEMIEGAFGKALRRRQMWELPDPPASGDDATWPYRLQSQVPPWWIPLIPERLSGGAEMRLRRARLGAWDTMDPSRTGPKSRLMDPTRAVTIDEAAVPVSGARMERHWQLARGYDGRVILWQSWKRSFGATDRASGLVYDAIDRKW